MVQKQSIRHILIQPHGQVKERGDNADGNQDGQIPAGQQLPAQGEWEQSDVKGDVFENVHGTATDLSTQHAVRVRLHQKRQRQEFAEVVPPPKKIEDARE